MLKSIKEILADYDKASKKQKAWYRQSVLVVDTVSEEFIKITIAGLKSDIKFMTSRKRKLYLELLEYNTPGNAKLLSKDLYKEDLKKLHKQLRWLKYLIV